MSRFNLLIAAVLTREEIKTLSQFAKSLTRSIIRGSQSRGARKSIMPTLDMIGVNNRNLKTFEVSQISVNNWPAIFPMTS
jgi:indole-3-glycerol phosphate synthase